ncbi:ABC transporter permease [Vulcanisaeta thermophila]|uniref:ABC transporter permease n=1 Tax=Vulcanisaeta thermophila TaxID=867917 RepID=UPI000852DF26|nr:ABC transporter permease [Vulcanisaeta thermophila]
MNVVIPQISRRELRKWRRILLSNKIFMAGLIIFILYVLMGTVGLLIIPPPSAKLAKPANAFKPPSLKDFPLYIFGTDYEGIPLISDIVWGTPFILEVSTLASVITVGIGVILGLLAGYIGGPLDKFLSAIFDIILTLPTFPIILILATFIHTNNPLILAGILSMFSWAGLARSVRGFTYSLKNQGYIETAIILGFNTRKIILNEMIYPMMPYILVHLFQDMMFYVYGLVGLYAYGFLPLTTANWGVVLDFAMSIGGAIYSPLGFWNLIIPLVTIIIYEIGLMFMALGADRLVNPRMRNF